MFGELKTSQALWESTGFVLPKSGILVPHPESQVLELHPLTPLFDLQIGSQKIGYISRGHSFVMPKYRGMGYFSQALSELEQLEIQFFRDGRFAEYRQAVYGQIGVGARFCLPTLARLQTPHHLEYWRLPDVAAYFIEHGYRLSEFCVSELRCRGVIQSEAPADVATALRQDHSKLKGRMIFMLLKTAAIDR